MLPNLENHWIKVIAAASVAATVLFSEESNANELVTATDLVANSEIIDELLASTTPVSSFDTDSETITLPEPEPAWIAFAKDCASLDAIPLVELKRERDRRVFVGINFDGVFGIHGQL